MVKHSPIQNKEGEWWHMRIIQLRSHIYMNSSLLYCTLYIFNDFKTNKNWVYKFEMIISFQICEPNYRLKM